MTKNKPDPVTIHVVAGPTASGKSAFALELAAQYNGVIINADSQQIYDGLPILSAQPSQDDKKQAPHELYAALDPNAPCSAGNWREMAEPVIERVIAAGQTPIVTGGSGLYIKALVEGLSPIPDIPGNVREAAVAKQKELGNPAFHAALKERDPVMAQRFHPHHTARLVRAWEVLEATGKSLSEWQKLPRIAPPDHWHFEVHKIIPERKKLHERINTRFDWMVENGALEEVADFAAQIENGKVRDGVPLTKALGFKPLLAYLSGEISKDDALERSKADTRQYAKRQITWFKGQL